MARVNTSCHYPFGFEESLTYNSTYQYPDLGESAPLSEYWLRESNDPDKRWIRSNKISNSRYRESKEKKRASAFAEPLNITPNLTVDPKITPFIDWYHNTLRKFIDLFQVIMGNPVTPDAVHISLAEEYNKLKTYCERIQRNNAQIRKDRDFYRDKLGFWGQIDERTGLTKLDTMKHENATLKMTVENYKEVVHREELAIDDLKRKLEEWKQASQSASMQAREWKAVLSELCGCLSKIFSVHMEHVNLKQHIDQLVKLMDSAHIDFLLLRMHVLILHTCLNEPSKTTPTTDLATNVATNDHQHPQMIDLTTTDDHDNANPGASHNINHNDIRRAVNRGLVNEMEDALAMNSSAHVEQSAVNTTTTRAPVANMTRDANSNSNGGGGARRTYSWLGNNNHTTPNWLTVSASRRNSVRDSTAVTSATGAINHNTPTLINAPYGRLGEPRLGDPRLGDRIRNLTPPTTRIPHVDAYVSPTLSTRQPSTVVSEDDDNHDASNTTSHTTMETNVDSNVAEEEDTSIDDMFNAEWDNY